MTRTLGILSVLCGVGSAWLVMADRRSPLALDVVEWDQRIGVPLYVLFAITGIVLVMLGSRIKRSVTRGLLPRPIVAQAPMRARVPALPVHPRQDDWLEERTHSARDLRFDGQVEVQVNTEHLAPVVLHMDRLTPEQVRRAVQTFGLWLSTGPLPPRAQVVYQNCMKPPGERHHQVAGALSAAVPRASFRVVSQDLAVDILFNQPDPCWTEAG